MCCTALNLEGTSIERGSEASIRVDCLPFWQTSVFICIMRIPDNSIHQTVTKTIVCGYLQLEKKHHKFYLNKEQNVLCLLLHHSEYGL